MSENLPATVGPHALTHRDALHQMSPVQMVEFGTEVANALAPIIEKQKLYVKIGPGKHVVVEGWTTLLAMLGIIPKERDVKYIDGDYEAYVDLVSLRTGAVVGGASAICGKTDPTWAGRPRNAQRSMAITRATGKAGRLGFSWIMKLAGYEATPAEEMDHVEASKPPQQQPAKSTYFNARDRDDISWLKAHPAVSLMDEVDTKKVALELHEKPRADIALAIKRVEDSHLAKSPPTAPEAVHTN
jgi:hypothetical protein